MYATDVGDTVLDPVEQEVLDRVRHQVPDQTRLQVLGIELNTYHVVMHKVSVNLGTNFWIMSDM